MKTETDFNSLVSGHFHDFDEAAVRVLQMMAQFIDLNTLFIARNDGKTNRIIKVLNKKEELVTEGDELSFTESYCNLSVDHGQQILIIPDVNNSDLTRELAVTKKLGGGTFIAIPIYYENGEITGQYAAWIRKSRNLVMNK
ncbi:hypothetical protein [Domibacillus antri]|uniref:hypothetical protein n=1 Tax=Domibacillus antri TaxID=1714264 RepID=UPI000A4F4B89|nr:hypothetical protein [Domibacillus antri]